MDFVINTVPLIFKPIDCPYRSVCPNSFNLICMDKYPQGFISIQSDQFDSNCIVCSY